MGYVCLFDFESATYEESASAWWKWGEFFSKWDPFTFALGIDRGRVSEKLIPHHRAKIDTGFTTVWIPRVEVWHDGAIPLNAISRVVVRGRSGALVADTSLGDGDLQRLWVALKDIVEEAVDDG